MRAGTESANVGEVKVLGDQESFRVLSCAPYRRVVASLKLFVRNSIDVVPQGVELRREFQG